MFAGYSFATESAENPSQSKSLNVNAYLSVKGFDDEGLALTLSDGSEWDISYFGGAWKLLGWGWIEQQEVSHWSVGDTIEMRYPSTGNFTDFLLIITNLSQKETAWVTLKRPPSVDCSDCLWVVDFDNDTNYMTLSDGTVYFRTDTNMFGTFFQHKFGPLSKWEPGDTLTLIRGEGWLNSNTFFLWNHMTNEMPAVESHKI